MEGLLENPVSQPNSPADGVRKYILLALLVVTPTGFLFKFYVGPGRWWFNDYGAGLLYEVSWVLVIFSFFPGGDGRIGSLSGYSLARPCWKHFSSGTRGLWKGFVRVLLEGHSWARPFPGGIFLTMLWDVSWDGG